MKGSGRGVVAVWKQGHRGPEERMGGRGLPADPRTYQHVFLCPLKQLPLIVGPRAPEFSHPSSPAAEHAGCWCRPPRSLGQGPGGVRWLSPRPRARTG